MSGLLSEDFVSGEVFTEIIIRCGRTRLLHILLHFDATLVMILASVLTQLVLDLHHTHSNLKMTFYSIID